MFGFSNEDELEKDRAAKRREGPGINGQITIEEQREVVRDPLVAVFALFSPVNGVTDKERAGIVQAYKSGKFTPEFTRKFEFESGRNWHFEIEPILKAWVEEPERAAKAASFRAEQERINIELENRGKLLLKCGHYVDPLRLLKSAHGGLQLSCFRCEKRFEVKLIVGKQL